MAKNRGGCLKSGLGGVYVGVPNSGREKVRIWGGWDIIGGGINTEGCSACALYEFTPNSALEQTTGAGNQKRVAPV